MKLATITTFVAIASAVMTTAAIASPEKGLEIAIEADSRDKGFGNSTAQIKMILMDIFERINGNNSFFDLKIDQSAPGQSPISRCPSLLDTFLGRCMKSLHNHIIIFIVLIINHMGQFLQIF